MRVISAPLFMSLPCGWGIQTEIMLKINKVFLFLLLLNSLHLCCRAQNQRNALIQGSVFVHTDLSVHSSILEQLDQYPFSGLRLDSINQNLMMIKYRTHEPYMDVNFKRIDGSDDFMSDGWILVNPETEKNVLSTTGSSKLRFSIHTF